jgi:streptogramin lyase
LKHILASQFLIYTLKSMPNDLIYRFSLGCMLLIFNSLAGFCQTKPLYDSVFVNPHPRPPRWHCERVENPAISGKRTWLILQDKYGYIWGYNDNGLFRYDGYIFEYMMPEFRQRILGIQEIGEGIWLSATGSVAYLRYHDLIYQEYARPQPNKNEGILIIAQKSPKELWVMVQGRGLHTLDINSGKYNPASDTYSTNALSGKKDAKPPQIVSEDFKYFPSRQEFWFIGLQATETGDSPHKKLYCFQTQTGKWVHYPLFAPQISGLTGIYLDEAREILWLARWQGGICTLDLKTKQYRRYLGNPQVTQPQRSFFGGVCTHISPFGKDELLFTDQNGLFIFNPQTLEAYQIPPVPDDVYTPVAGEYGYEHVLRTREGIYWLSGQKGILKIDPLHQQFNAHTLNTTYEDAQTCYYDPQQKKASISIFHDYNLSYVRTFDFFKQTIDTVEFRQFRGKHSPMFTFQDGKGQFWLRNHIGFYHWNRQTNQCTRVELKDTQQKIIRDTFPLPTLREVVVPLANGDFWFTASHRGLAHYQANKQVVQFYSHQANNPNSPPSNSIELVFCDSRGYVWFSCSWLGVSYFHPASGRWRHFRHEPQNPQSLSSDAVFGVNEDARGRIWIAGIGLCYYDPQTDKIHRLPDFNSECRRPFFDSAGNLWTKVIGQDALGRLDARTQKMTLFRREHGFQFVYYGSQLFQLTPNEFLFSNGIYFDARKIYLNPHAPTPRISSFKIFEKEPDWAKKINFMPEVVLDYTQNFISIEFTAMSFTEPEKCEYAYRLRGYDRDWVYSGARRTAYYTGLHGGEYMLEYKAANNHGLWGKAKTLKIIIIPPYWETWWFRTLVVLALLAVIYGIYRFRIGQIRQEANFRRRLAETEMAALRAQMNPHFIFNCLSSIHHFTLSNDAKSAAKYLTKFARLIRLVLENSREPKLLLAKELEAIRIYVEMERLRFSNHFQFELNLSPEVDKDTISIPPLLIQPYIENAIWHGLMQKTESGIIQLNISQPQSNCLHIEIIDDGIGRARAQELKSKSALLKKSFGMKITMNRIAAINELYDIETKVKVIDLLDEDGKAAGTQVILEIPI